MDDTDTIHYNYEKQPGFIDSIDRFGKVQYAPVGTQWPDPVHGVHANNRTVQMHPKLSCCRCYIARVPSAPGWARGDTSSKTSCLSVEQCPNHLPSAPVLRCVPSEYMGFRGELVACQEPIEMTTVGFQFELPVAGQITTCRL